MDGCRAEDSLALVSTHLIRALASLDRASEASTDALSGQRFVQFDVASRAIHCALVTLDEWGDAGRLEMAP